MVNFEASFPIHLCLFARNNNNIKKANIVDFLNIENNGNNNNSDEEKIIMNLK